MLRRGLFDELLKSKRNLFELHSKYEAIDNSRSVECDTLILAELERSGGPADGTDSCSPRSRNPKIKSLSQLQ